ncbi:response regulator [Psychrobium sp. MM17-31]|uniref:response regulator n=1 Tax=Psychrobium sp. MM17-31 TaxID=2917758 RepID=UPI001EF408DC|nr:response regulator [Psychrobium sp. MM17-31]MCG7532104.1 response regulator [Psychrobium sp. MM17-31]
MKRIQDKLLILLILVALVPTFISEFLTYQSTKNEQIKQTYYELEATLHHRLELISQLFDREIGQANTLAKSPQIINQAIAFNNLEQTDTPIAPDIERYLVSVKDKEHLKNIYLVNASGDIKFATASTDDVDSNIYTGQYNTSPMSTITQDVLRTKVAAHSRFAPYSADGNSFSSFIAQPIIENNILLGAIVFQLSPQFLLSVSEIDPTLGDTGEVLLAHLDGNKVQFLSPRRFAQKNSKPLALDLGAEMSHAIQRAVQGDSGQGESLDYRLVDVVSVWKYSPEFNIGIVVKKDTVETLANISAMQVAIYAIVFAISIPLIIFAYFISRHYTRPIISMVNSTNAIASGDMEQELEVTSQDEIGQLATSINEMSNHINEAFQNEEAERWLQEGMVKLSETMRGNQISTDLADNIVSFVCGYLNAKVGSLYIVKDQELELAGGFAFVPHFANQTIEFGDGLIGQAAISKKVMTISDLPEDYVSISSSMGEISPQTLIIFPLLKDDVVVGVMELGWLEKAHSEAYRYVEAITESIATALSVAESHQKLQELLDQSQQHMEELQVREEELRAINEEVEQRSTQLANSQKKLEQQSQELHATNEALEHKNAAIEAKNTEIEKSRQEISEKAEQLEASSRYKSEFLANMSHELRTPLNSMLILSRILADNEDGNLDQDQVESSKVIHRSGQELLSLINDILDLSKIEAGKMEVLYESYNLRDITYELNGQFSPITNEKGLSFEIDVDNEVPAEMALDVQKVQQILKNLLSNAVKFTEVGSVKIQAKYADAGRKYHQQALNENPVLAISIIDSGIGISEEKQKAIFEAFQQADGSTSRKYGGTGLGLTISRHLTSLIEGELGVESTPDQGSKFTLYIPVKDAIENTEEIEEPSMFSSDPSAIMSSPASVITVSAPVTTPPIAESVQQPLESPTLTAAEIKQTIDASGSDNKVVVIIEDDVNFSKVLATLAKKSGFDCVLASTGAQGINLVKEHKPCGVILDLGLPDLPGADILEILKEQPETRDIPVHVISGHNKTKELTDKGAAAFHQKPIATQEIRTLLYSLVKESPSQSEQQLIVFDQGDSNTDIDLAFLDDTTMNVVTVHSLDELSHNLGNAGESVSGIIIKSNQLTEEQLSWLSDNHQYNDERNISVIVFVDQAPSQEQVISMEQLDCHVIIEGAHSNERLHDEVLLFLSKVEPHSEQESTNPTSPPVADVPIASTPLPQQATPSPTNDGQTSFEGCEVLLVDDDLRNTFALSKVLKKQGMKVTLADNGQMALERLEANSAIDIVLMDIMMPVMDGHEAMRQIRAQEKYANLPIIALTAKAMQEDRRKCVEAGASDYLTKPVDIDKLIAMMRVWLYQEVT